jgi:NTP pyrophosphatase (non-canonical NTP hydrolase)
MAELKNKPQLKDIQLYLKQLCAERGWDKNNYLEIFLLFTEEVGELAHALRNYHGLYKERGRDYDNVRENLEDEFADVFNYFLDLANYFDVDLEKAFRNKEEKNSKRIWE